MSGKNGNRYTFVNKSGEPNTSNDTVSCVMLLGFGKSQQVLVPPRNGYSGDSPMITLLGTQRRLCDGLTRRETLKAGALSLLGGAFNLPSLLWAEQNRPALNCALILV